MQGHIKAITTERIGGGFEVDFIELRNGKFLTITEDCLVVRDTRQSFYDETDGVPDYKATVINF